MTPKFEKIRDAAQITAIQRAKNMDDLFADGFNYSWDIHEGLLLNLMSQLAQLGLSIKDPGLRQEIQNIHDDFGKDIGIFNKDGSHYESKR